MPFRADRAKSGTAAGPARHAVLPDDHADAPIDTRRTELDAGRRRAMVAEALKLAADDTAHGPLCRRALSAVMQKKVQVVMPPEDTFPVGRVAAR